MLRKVLESQIRVLIPALAAPLLIMLLVNVPGRLHQVAQYFSSGYLDGALDF